MYKSDIAHMGTMSLLSIKEVLNLVRAPTIVSVLDDLILFFVYSYGGESYSKISEGLLQ